MYSRRMVWMLIALSVPAAALAQAQRPRGVPEPYTPAKDGKRSSGSTTRSSGGRRGREAQPPSWRKVLKRGAIFAPIFLATVMLLGGGKLTLPGAIVQTVLLLAVFVPFSYFMDRVVYRQQLKRLNKGS